MEDGKMTSQQELSNDQFLQELENLLVCVIEARNLLKKIDLGLEDEGDSSVYNPRLSHRLVN
jgi:hypothetical protein